MFRLTYWKRFLYLTVVLLCVVPSPSHSQDEEVSRLPLAMEVFLKKPKVRWYELHIHLTNISSSTVTVDLTELPWNPPNDYRWFSAIRLDDQNTSILPKVRPWKIGSRRVQLLPGESIQDTIALNSHIPSFLNNIDQFGVKVQWDCPPPALRLECKDGAPTSITFPKQDPGTPDAYTINTHTCRQREETIGLISIPPDHHLLFLFTSESVMKDLKQIQALLLEVDDYVRECQPTWTNSWAASFFTDKKLAGFLGDENHEELFKKGTWQQINIGQYSSQIRKLFRFPWIKKQSDTRYLSIYGLRRTAASE